MKDLENARRLEIGDISHIITMSNRTKIAEILYQLLDADEQKDFAFVQAKLALYILEPDYSRLS